MEEWIYFAFSVGLIFASPSYHYLKEFHPSFKIILNLFKDSDWIIALGAYCYMFYYIFTKVTLSLQIPFTIALVISLLFFWYGFKYGDYKKLHPWFHIFAFTISGLIVISKV